ncbi:MAG: FxLYD domain-containing protein [Anaerolineae bacterium]
MILTDPVSATLGLGSTATITITDDGDPYLVHLPLVLRYFPPLPFTPSLSAINNPDADGDYTVSWREQPVAFADTYVLQEATNAEFTENMREVCSTPNQSCEVTGRVAGTYYYRVMGRNSYGESDWSNAHSATVLPADTPILNGIGNEDGDGSYTVSWAAAARAETYRLQEDDNPDFSSPNEVYSGAETSWSATSRVQGTYYYRVQALAPEGDSDWSNVHSATVLPADTPTLNGIDNTDCDGSYAVSWNSAARAESYTLQEDDNPDFNSPDTVYSGAGTSWTASNKSQGTYYYRVRALAPEGDSGWSNVHSATVLPPDTPVLNGIENADGDGNYTVSWQAAARATSYQLQEDDNSDFSSPKDVYVGPGLSWNAVDQAYGTFYYRVAATGPTGQGEWSNVQNVEVPAPPPEVIVMSSNAFVPYSGSSSLYIVGEILNNTSSNVEFVEISATLRDSSGNVVGSDYSYSMIDVLSPGMTSPFRIIFSDPLSFSYYELSVNWHTTSDPTYPLEVLNSTSYFDSYDEYHVVGEIRNQYGEERRFAAAYVTLYDSAGEVIGADYSYTNPDDLSPGQTASFDTGVYFWQGKPDRARVARHLLQVITDW